MQIKVNDNEFQLFVGEKRILEHSKERPMIYVGVGQEDVDMYRGNFKITDYVTERFPLKLTDVIQTADTVRLCFESYIIAKIKCDENLCTIDFEQKDDRINRFWFRVAADKEEKCYGCGEQMSYFNLRGRNFPIWTSEPGVGRDKTTYVTWRSDVENKAGGDYYNTNYPQPTFVSTNKYYLHVDSTAYADFDFRNDSFHELQIWEVPKQIRIECADTYLKLLERLTAYFGRQPKLPDWVYNGLIIGVQGGNERSFGLLDKTLDKNIKVAGIWCQDWCGKRVTSFGKRLQWDWKYHKEMYPDLPKKIKEINAKGIKFLGYVNPYLVNDGELYKHRVYINESRQPLHGILIIVILKIGIRSVSLMCPHKWCKHRHLSPSEKQLLCTSIIKKRCIASNITMREPTSHHSCTKCSADNRCESIMYCKVNRLIAGPQQCAVFLASGTSGTHEVNHISKLS